MEERDKPEDEKNEAESDDEDTLGVEDGEEPGDNFIVSLGYADY